MSPLAWVAFVAAGAIGAPARYLVGGWIQGRTGGDAPWGTFVVNVSGSFLLGLLTGLALYRGFPDMPRVVLGSGFCGAYTTFSTFSYETIRLLEDGATAKAVANVAGTLVVAVGAAAAGLAIASI